MNRVVIVGCGNIGMAYAYSMVISGTAVDEIVLIDVNKEKAEGEAMDLNHALSYAPRRIDIRSGNYDDCKGAKIVCICAGASQLPGETRTDLLEKNIKIFESILSEVKRAGFSGIFVTATNPLDTLAYATMKIMGYNPNKVIGSGTTLDTARLKYMIAKSLDVNAKDVHGYVLGEHGDSEFVAWGNAVVGGNRCEELLSKDEMARISYEVRNSAYDIINKKGNTSYGIGMCLKEITNAILSNERKILTVSCYDKNYDCYFSKPCLVGKNGIVKQIDISLSNTDSAKLMNSVTKLQLDKKLLPKKYR